MWLWQPNLLSLRPPVDRECEFDVIDMGCLWFSERYSVVLDVWGERVLSLLSASTTLEHGTELGNDYYRRET